MSPARPAPLGRMAAALIGALASLALSAEPSSAEPARLRITIDRPVVEVGSRTPVILELLDREFQPTPNDRDRMVRFEIRQTRNNGEGAGAVDPNPITVPSSALRDSTASFTAAEAGSVLVRATSDGLAPGEVIIRIDQAQSFVSRLLFPVLHAQRTRPFEILPRGHEPFPLNDRSTAQFTIFVNDPVPSGRHLRYRVDTEPAVRIRYGKDQQSEGVGVATIEIAAGRWQSEPFHVSAPSDPGAVVIRAQSLPTGHVDQARVEFVPPVPARVGLEPQTGTVTSHQRIVPLEVQLLDRDGLPLQALDRPHLIEIESDSGSQRVEPQRITLSATRLQGSSRLYLPRLRLGGTVKVFARSENVAHGEAQLQVVAAAWALLVLAWLGGFLGGLARHIYRVRTPHIWPRRLKGRLEPGLIGNALFSALSGVVLFQAIDLGIFHALDQLGQAHGNATLAFVLGVAGGFAGVVVFEALTDRLLPGKTQVQPSN
ncbi:MAG: hypothetical protein ACRD2X_20040 [Vicinamibacteraceae bacterium]